MREENEEYLEAAIKGDLSEVADALEDMFYLLCGTITEDGLEHKIEAVFYEIQQSNTSKLDENPIYNENGKVIKGSNYFSPKLEKALKAKRANVLNSIRHRELRNEVARSVDGMRS